MSSSRLPVLLLRPDRGGNAIKTLPGIRVLRALRPEWELHVLCSQHNGSIFEFESGIRTHLLPTAWGEMGSENLYRWVKQEFEGLHFAKIISLPCDPSPEQAPDTSRLLEFLPGGERYAVGGRELEGYSPVRPLALPNNSPEGRSEVENVAHLLTQALGIDVVRAVAHYSSAPVLVENDWREAQEKMGPKVGEWLGFCPFSGKSRFGYSHRRWQRFVGLATRNRRFQKFFLFGLPEDYQAMLELRNASARKEDVELCFPSCFRTLGAYLSRLDGVVAVESGPLNLALSLGVPSLGLLSGGDPSRWFPPSREEDRVVKRGLFNRSPSTVEMWWAFRKWEPILPGPVAEQLSFAFH